MTDINHKKLTIAIAGATGFVGEALAPALAKEAHLIGLSRSRDSSDGGSERAHEIEWRRCDLFSLIQINKALVGVDVVVYLVHSMLPSAALVQAKFDDLDLILADNFARALRQSSVKHVVYLSGMLPDAPIQTWSRHLLSRYEVEQVLATSGIPVTVCRAGLVVGPGGSSLEILRRLIMRLPLLICPAWTEAKSSPVSLERVVAALSQLALKNNVQKAQVYDLCEAMGLSYKEMMQESARVLGKKRIFLSINLLTPTLSRLWVSVVTGAPKNLVYPLVMSLGHTLLPRNDHLLAPFKMDKPFSEIARTGLISVKNAPGPHAFKSGAIKRYSVRSVQRLELDHFVATERVAREYLNWLPKFLAPFLQVKVRGNVVGFYFIFIRRALLILALSEKRSSIDRVLFYIRGGLLARRVGRGRLEFRTIAGMPMVLAAIHDFHPRLHWKLYKFTQAPFHLFVMKAFGRHLRQGHYEQV